MRSEAQLRRSVRAHFLLLLTLVACTDACSESSGAPTEAPSEPPEAPPGVRGAIAYVKGRELRIVQPDGTGDRAVWTVPDALYSITGLAWRPDGGEIAFASNHEMATSFYERDLYAIRPDGSGLRKLTNPPTYEGLASYAKGTVTVAVQNATFDAGPYFVYVLGAKEPKQLTIAAASTVRLTFQDVADLGAGTDQPVVVINGINRWWNAAAVPDVRAGATVDAGTVMIGANPFQHWGADAPFWRADGSKVGFIGLPTCLLQQAAAAPSPGASYAPLVDPAVFQSICTVDWAPTTALADQLLIADPGEYVTSGETSIYRVREGSSSKGQPLVTFDDYVRVWDLRWLPDGSGFIVGRQNALLDESVNLIEIDFATRAQKRITNFSGESVRRFAISPDGRSIVFERVREMDGPADLWTVRRDGSELRLLTRGGEAPAW
jgi:hypothetical protein